jgi:hypothetical protein
VVNDDLEPTDFQKRAQALFEDSVERLDARTRSKLTQARNRALDEVKQGASRRWIWAPAGGFAVAAVIAVGVLMWPGGRTPQPGAAIEDLEIVADSDNLELLQDVEFYAWLDEQ